MIPADVIDLQGTLAEGLAADPRLRSHVESILGLTDRAFNVRLGEEQLKAINAGADYGQVIDHMAAAARGGHSYHVSSEMAELVFGAAAQLNTQDEYTLEFPAHEAPTSSGFVVFDRPILFPDRQSDPEEFERQCREAIDEGLFRDRSDGARDRLALQRSVHDLLSFSAMSWHPAVGRALSDSIASRNLGDGDQAGVRFTFYAEVDTHTQWLVDSLRGFETMLRMCIADERRILNESAELFGISPELFEQAGRAYWECAKRGDPEGTWDCPDEEFARKVIDNPEWHDVWQEAVLMWSRTFSDEEAADNHPKMEQEIDQGIAADLPHIRRYRLIPVASVMWPRASVPVVRADALDPDTLVLMTTAWTFFYFCRQTVVVHGSEKPPRAAARRWRDMPMPKLTTTVTLRRATAGESVGDHDNVQWRHRWLVRGHWRMQPYGPGKTERRPVWIAPFVKGPTGAPLLMSNKVYNLIR